MKRATLSVLISLLTVMLIALPASAHQEDDEPDPDTGFFTPWQEPVSNTTLMSSDEALLMLTQLITEFGLWDVMGIEFEVVPDSGPLHDQFHELLPEQTVMGGCHQGYWQKTWICMADSGPPDFVCTEWKVAVFWHSTHNYGC